MSLPSIDEVKDLNLEQLSKEILILRKQLFTLRMRKATRQAFTPHSIKHAKHRLRQLLMIYQQKQNDD